jgi:hypothetical protein
MIYLATPFSDPDPAVRLLRYQQALDFVAHSYRKGHNLYSPIVYGFPIAKILGNGDWSFWERFDLDTLSRCDELWVLRLPGWDKSRGVRAEIEYANAHKIPTQMMYGSIPIAAIGD